MLIEIGQVNLRSPMATLDTELDLLLARKEYFARNASAGTLEIAPDEPLFIAVRFTGEIAPLEAAGFRLGNRVGHIAYEAANATWLNEFLKEQRKVQEQDVTIAQLKKDFQATIARQQKQIEVLTAGLQKIGAQLELSKPAQQTVLNEQ